jgi:hypothetical protein
MFPHQMLNNTNMDVVFIVTSQPNVREIEYKQIIKHRQVLCYSIIQ